eukprot:5070006-Pyramimonas_sp.AAC.1
MRPRTQHRASWPHGECHLSPVAVSACVSPPSTSFRGPIGGSTDGPSGGVHVRLPTRHSVSWRHRELHLRPQW